MKPTYPFANCLATARDAVDRSARLLEEVHAGARNSRMQIAVSRHRLMSSRKAIDSAPRADPDTPAEETPQR